MPIPSIVIITDEDVRILYRNRAARELLKAEKIYGNCLGDVMPCVHSDESPAGSGHGQHCANKLYPQQSD